VGVLNGPRLLDDSLKPGSHHQKHDTGDVLAVGGEVVERLRDLGGHDIAVEGAGLPADEPTA
jgi:hypothetical protein